MKHALSLILLGLAAYTAVAQNRNTYWEWSGDCTVADRTGDDTVGSGVGSCIQTANYPAAYGSNQQCIFSPVRQATLSVTRNPITDRTFDLESGYDMLTWTGMEDEYVHPIGALFRNGVDASGVNYTFESDGSIQRGGFQLCYTCVCPTGSHETVPGALCPTVDYPCTPCHPSCSSCSNSASCDTCAEGFIDPTPADQGDNLCRVAPLQTSDATVCPLSFNVTTGYHCVTSQNYGTGQYGVNGQCSITAFHGWSLGFLEMDWDQGADGFKNGADFINFDTEGISVNTWYPQADFPTNPLIWTTDAVTTGPNAGFKLCAACACTPGNYLSAPCTASSPSPTCAVCDDSCETCDDATSCNTCAPGYYKDPSAPAGSLCEPCIEGCNCDSDTACTGCIDGYYPSGEVCAACQDSCKTCSVTDPDRPCLECNAGSYLTPDFMCADCVANCALCSDGTGCDMCAQGFIKNLDGVCVPAAFAVLSSDAANACEQFIDVDGRFCVTSPNYGEPEGYPVAAYSCSITSLIRRGLLLEDYDLNPNDQLTIDGEIFPHPAGALPYFARESNDTEIQFSVTTILRPSGVHRGFKLCKACGCDAGSYSSTCDDNDSQVCDDCHESCSLCQDQTSCTTCAPGYADLTPSVLDNDHCVLADCCAENEYPTAACSADVVSCEPCPEGCSHCSGPDSCNGCIAPYFPDPEDPTKCLQALWSIEVGDCFETYQDGEYCVYSPNYGTGDYPSNHQCSFEQNFDRMFQVRSWNVENRWDGFDGTPNARLALALGANYSFESKFSFFSDGSVQKTGFKLCSICDCSGNTFLDGECEPGVDTPCTECSEGCVTCDNLESCTACASGYYTDSSSGLLQCPKCDDSCATCLDGETCQTCADGYVDYTPDAINNDLCVAPWAEVTASNPAGARNKCIAQTRDANTVCITLPTYAAAYECLFEISDLVRPLVLDTAPSLATLTMNRLTRETDDMDFSNPSDFLGQLQAGDIIRVSAGAPPGATDPPPPPPFGFAICDSCVCGDKEYASTCEPMTAVGCTACPANCDACDASGCLECSDGYYNDAGTCAACADDCATCSDGAACDTCPPDAYLNDADQRCVTCAGCGDVGLQYLASCSAVTGVPECLDCSSPNCLEGTYLMACSATADAMCKSCPEGCATCDDDTACATCPDGFFLDSGACSACDATCGTCDSAGTCLTCAEGHYSAGARVCAACDASCASCSNDSTCTTCAENYWDPTFDTQDNDLCQIYLFSVTEGGCEVTFDQQEFCVQTPGFPAKMPGGTQCEINVNWNERALLLESLNLGPGDQLWYKTSAEGEWMPTMAPELPAALAGNHTMYKLTTTLDSTGFGFQMCDSCGCERGFYVTNPPCTDRSIPQCQACDESCATCENADTCTICSQGYLDATPGEQNNDLCKRQLFDMEGPCPQFYETITQGEDPVVCITSPGYPANYPANQKCRMTVTQERSLVLLDFAVEGGGWDELVIGGDFDPNTDSFLEDSTGAIVGLVVSDLNPSLPWIFEDNKNETIIFRSDGSVQRKGFKICESCVCPDRYYAPTGVVCVAEQDLTCQPCDSSCNLCNSTGCIDCSEGYYLSAPGVCSPCNSACATCIDDTTCTTCAAGKRDFTPETQNNDLCGDDCCAVKQFSVPECTAPGQFATCIDCDASCASCSSLNNCLECEEGYSRIGEQGLCYPTYFETANDQCPLTLETLGDETVWCITSPNFNWAAGSQYPPSAFCEWNILFPQPLKLVNYEGETNYDGIKIVGVPDVPQDFRGFLNPPATPYYWRPAPGPEVKFSFTSDTSVQRKGFKLCQAFCAESCETGQYASACDPMTAPVCTPCAVGCQSCQNAESCFECKEGYFMQNGVCQECEVCGENQLATTACTANANTVCSRNLFNITAGSGCVLTGSGTSDSSVCLTSRSWPEPYAPGMTCTFSTTLARAMRVLSYDMADDILNFTEPSAYVFPPGSTLPHLVYPPQSTQSVVFAANSFGSGTGFRICLECACPSGQYSANGCPFDGDQSCAPCASGCAECNDGTSCTKCPMGYSLTDEGSCEPCPAGQSSDGMTCADCPAGTRAPSEGSPECDSCPEHRYSAAGAATCTACPAIDNCPIAGLTCTNSADSACTSCTEGYFVSSVDGSCSACQAPGCAGPTSCSSATDYTCTDCMDGFRLTTGYQCEACPPVANCAVPLCADGDQGCGTCNPGYFAEVNGVCEANTVTCGDMEYPNNNVCTPCPQGSYSLAGAESCTVCEDGQYADTTRYQCSACAAVANCMGGVTCSVFGDSQCSSCMTGYYGQSCQMCPALPNCASVSCTGAANSQCLACNVGYYQNSNGACLMCDAVENCDTATCASAGSSMCAVCSSGYASVDGGCQQIALDCEAGEGVDATNPDNIQCAACDAGFYGAGGTAVCVECAPGTYTTSPTKPCAVCAPMGCMTPSTDTTSCTCDACMKGYYPDNDACSACSVPDNCRSPVCTDAIISSCEVCEDGYYKNAEGACSKCSVGNNCQVGLCANADTVLSCFTCETGFVPDPANPGDCTEAVTIVCDSTNLDDCKISSTMFEVSLTDVNIAGTFQVSVKSVDTDSLDDDLLENGSTALTIEVTATGRHKRADISLGGTVCLQVPTSLAPNTLYVIQKAGDSSYPILDDLTQKSEGLVCAEIESSGTYVASAPSCFDCASVDQTVSLECTSLEDTICSEGGGRPTQKATDGARGGGGGGGGGALVGIVIALVAVIICGGFAFNRYRNYTNKERGIWQMSHEEGDGGEQFSEPGLEESGFNDVQMGGNDLPPSYDGGEGGEEIQQGEDTNDYAPRISQADYADTSAYGTEGGHADAVDELDIDDIDDEL